MRRAALVLVTTTLALLLASGVAWAITKIGTDGPDTLQGTNQNDTLIGKGGQDDIFALGGRDTLLGGKGKDNVFGGTVRRPRGGEKALVGGEGNDLVLGGLDSDTLTGDSGNDWVDGAFGSDIVWGGNGNDYVADGESEGGVTDTLEGGDGNDVVDAINKPAHRDVLECGGGFDRAFTDKKDLVAPDCEKVAVGLAAVRELDQRLIESGYFQRLFEGLPPAPEG
jgi:Ca2+-binding RTX toxin-like protein